MSYVKISKFIVYFTFVIFCLLVLYYSWLPNPSFKTEIYLPNSLIQWTEEHGTIRTGVPFVLLGINAIILNIKKLSPIKNFLILFLLLWLAEIGQFFLKYRHFDFMDIFAGTVAIIMGLGIGLGLRRAFKPKEKEI